MMTNNIAHINQPTQISPEIRKLSAIFQKAGNPLMDERCAEITLATEALVQQFIALDHSSKALFAMQLKEEAAKENPYALLYVYSLLLHIDAGNTSLDEVYEYILTQSFDMAEKYFVYNQLKSYRFMGLTKDSSIKATILYKHIIAGFNHQLVTHLQYIPAAQRNEQLVLVFTSQLLGLNHAPTKTVMDRCRILKQHLGKEVILINTCELMPRNGMLPWYEARFSHRADAEHEQIEYKGVIFQYAQLSKIMPNIPEMLQVINIVQALKPGFILTIGESLIADICSQIVPNAVLATVFSGLPYSPSQFLITGRQINAQEKQQLTAGGMSEYSVIESTFTFDFKTQQSQLSRKQLGLPADKFLIILVGGRLHTEITAGFIQQLTTLFEQNIHFVLAGNFEPYQHYCETITGFASHVSYIGFQNDMLAVLECCDVYLNPPRTGGGSSAAEALYKGLPVITLPQGDVATAAGQDFIVPDIDAMLTEIRKYQQDQDYYQLKSLQGKARASVLLDSEQAVREIVQQISLHHFYDQPWQLPAN